MPSSSPKTPRHGFDLEMFEPAGPGHRGNVSMDGKDSAPAFWISISAVQLKQGGSGTRVLLSRSTHSHWARLCASSRKTNG